MDHQPILGLYDSILTQKLAKQIDQWRESGLIAGISEINEEQLPLLIGRYVGKIVTELLSGIREPQTQIQLANDLLATLENADLISENPLKLTSLIRDEPGSAPPDHPLTTLSETALLTNAKDDPNLSHELALELTSADRVDIICAFIKWSGLRLLKDPFEQLRRRGVPVRIITTTYMGATERRALDRLVNEFGAQVKISYEERSTRLHAKAWLLRRDTGFDTAYIGSSNLSRAALVDGLEWNVRLSREVTPRLISKFEGTFDSYWSRAEFERYDPTKDAERLDEALASSRNGQQLTSVSHRVPIPYPHQVEMLNDLEVERVMYDRHQNLLVSATGTGKTVTAAFDYRNLQKELRNQPSLLFVAHRQEILQQAMQTYRHVLAAPDFGELHVGEDKASHWQHVFASVQSVSRIVDQLDPHRFDVVVIDEFHHAHAPTYRRIIEHLRPKELLGLTATPERSDGTWVQDEFFNGRIASELRLWDALDADLLCPFHYFGIDDETDLSSISWSRASYDTRELDNALADNRARAQLVFNALLDKSGDLNSLRGLGFCVSIRHAHHMAKFFTESGIPSLAVDGGTSEIERKTALNALRSGTTRFLFAVDLFNEGLDIPDVNTLLLLRPTESATVFLQQLGRGLRRTSTKDVLTVLDFVGQHRREYRFENRFYALTGFQRNRLKAQAESGFPVLPPGCQIILDRVTKDRLISGLQEHLRTTVTVLSREIKAYDKIGLANYLEASGRDIYEIYRSKYWTNLLRRTGLLEGPSSALEESLGRRIRVFLHVDDLHRAEAYAALLKPNDRRYEDCSPIDQAFMRMLFFSLWRDGGGFKNYDEALTSLRSETAIAHEIQQVIELGANRPRHVTKPLVGELAHLPLAVNARYSADEILAAIGWASIGGSLPSTMREGVAWAPATRCDALLVTLRKDERDFSPRTMYRDYALTSDLFHWESQHRTGANTTTGLRYQNHVKEGSHVLLFTRVSKQENGTTEPFVFHGTVRYVEHVGERPMAVTWKLDEEMPVDLFRRAAMAT
ncbi:DUF3427 domain-containing protein [Rhizohabitans arisaemae]|uniref:DUF3427 domain-containing protein n=1 Tax=Rhizohabitans arisaemae TaxID=2720610 RepID=UPI0024B0F7E3|nr:DEAD/DEAH box helicase [Rhizohabitans arisaemae]